MKFDIIVSDPPWSFSDSLTMSAVKRGSASNYRVMSNEDIIGLPVKDIVADNAVLALWVPSSLLAEGMQAMSAWGFVIKQTFIWVKIKKNPLTQLVHDAQYFLTHPAECVNIVKDIRTIINTFDINEICAFGLGRLFRQTHEIVLVGIRGKVYDKLLNKSQRSVCFGVVKKHSEKPELLQDRLELMFPDTIEGKLNRLEMFARRDRPIWCCVGLECPSTIGEDIRDSIKRLKNL